MGQALDANLSAIKPLLVRMRVCKLRLDLIVGDDPALFKVDEQHLARLKPPFLDDLFLGHRERTSLGSEDDPIAGRNDVAGRAKAVAIQSRADLPAIGEGHRSRAVPRFHESGMILIECT